MLYYKGYRAVSESTGERLEVLPGDNYDVRVQFGKERIHEKVRIWFAGEPIWHLATIVSVLTFLSLCCFALIKRPKRLKP